MSMWEKAFLRAIEAGADRLPKMLGEYWPIFRPLLKALRRAVAANDEARARWLVDEMMDLAAESPAADEFRAFVRRIYNQVAVKQPLAAQTERSTSLAPNMGLGLEPEPVRERANEVAPQLQFQFRIEGDQVRGNAVLADGDADLSLFLGPEASDAIARIRGTKLEQALEKGAEIGVLLAPVGYWLREGECHQVARIRNRALDRELVFRLKAGSASNPHAGAWIYLDLDGIAIGAFFVELPIVEDLADAPEPRGAVPAIDLDLVGEPVRARLCITQDAGELTISYHNSATGFSSQKRLRALTLSTLTTSLGAVQDIARKAAVSALWRKVADWFEHAPTPAQQRQLVELTQQVARAGWTLWAHLTQDGDLAPVLRDIDRLVPGSRIEIVTNNVFVPWEIVYPDNPAVLGKEDPAQVVKPQLFWGSRYIVQSTLSESRNIAAERRVHAAGPVEAALCLSPAIDGDFTDVVPPPGASHKPWAEKVQARMRVVLQEDPEQARRMLLREHQVPKWIYLFCHGHGGATDALELGGGDEFVLRPEDLQNTARFNGRPIVFLNSCSSGAHAPLSLTNFYQAMRVCKEALGIIGTSFPVPATIAAAIGQRLSDLYLGGDDLGTALFKVRRELMGAWVPIGLFYTLHAPADACALRTD